MLFAVCFRGNCCAVGRRWETCRESRWDNARSAVNDLIAVLDMIVDVSQKSSRLRCWLSVGLWMCRTPSSRGCALRRHRYCRWSKSFSEPAWPRMNSTIRMYEIVSSTSLFSVQVKVKASEHCFKMCVQIRLIYENVLQAELQWKLEECNRLWVECKVRHSGPSV